MRPIVQVNTERVRSSFLESLEFVREVDLKENNALQADLVVQSFPRPFAISLGSCAETKSRHFAGAMDDYEKQECCFQAPQCFERMKQVQEGYRNCAAIIICDNDDQWNNINVEFPPGVMRLHWVQSVEEMCTVMDELYKEMSLATAGENLKKQANFFQEAKNRLCHSKNSLRVYIETLGQLNIPSRDREEIMTKLPSVKAMATLDYKKNRTKMRVEKEHLQSLDFFFSPPIQ
jgi:hypothetical protein